MKRSEYAPLSPPLAGQDIQLVALHMLWQRSVGQSQNTIKGRHQLLRRFRHQVGVPLLEVTPDQLVTWQQSLAHMAPESIANYVGHVQGFYRWARRYRHREDDPTVDMLQRPRVPRGVPKPIPDDQLKLALACALPPMRAKLALMAFAGLRCTEVAGLRREDIRDTDDPAVITITGKGGHARIVPAPAALLSALHTYGLPPAGPVFRNANGRPYTANRMSQIVNDHLHKIGISYSAHKLRHAFGTAAYRLSGDLLLTQHLMGHASPNTTQGYVQYADAAATKLAKLMDGRGRGLLGLPPDEDPPPTAVPGTPDNDPDPVPLAGAADPQRSGYGHGLRLIRGGAA